MEPIGQRLRQARERLGLTQAEVERATHIRAHHLDAIERSDWEALPSPVQARGFLRNYADFLGLNAEAILTDYAGVAGHRRPRSRPEIAAAGVSRVSRRPRWLSPDLLVTIIIALAVLATLVWGGSRLMASMRQQTQADLNGGSGLTIPTSEVTPSPTPVLDAGPLPTSEVVLVPTGSVDTPTVTPTFGVAGAVAIRLEVDKRAWVRVLVDGTEKYVGRPGPGDNLEFQAEKTIELITGNGAGLHVFLNGQDLGRLGDLGQDVDRIYTVTGPQTPTPTPSPTPTITPRISSTPTPSSTPVPAGG